MESYSKIVEERVKELKNIEYDYLVPFVTKVYSIILSKSVPQYYFSSIWESVSLFLIQIDKRGGIPKSLSGTFTIQILGSVDGSVMTDIGSQTLVAMFSILFNSEIFDKKVKYFFEFPLPYVFGFFPETNANSKKYICTRW